jgi:hypothetical protein
MLHEQDLEVRKILSRYDYTVRFISRKNRKGGLAQYAIVTAKYPGWEAYKAAENVLKKNYGHAYMTSGGGRKWTFRIGADPQQVYANTPPNNKGAQTAKEVKARVEAKLEKYKNAPAGDTYEAYTLKHLVHELSECLYGFTK